LPSLPSTNHFFGCPNPFIDALWAGAGFAPRHSA